jgi:hypothetical protein
MSLCKRPVNKTIHQKQETSDAQWQNQSTPYEKGL